MKSIPDVKKIEKKLISLQESKDEVLDLSREIIRLCGKSITLMHARRMREANAGLKKITRLVAKLRQAEKGFEYFSLQAHQEYVEALTLYTIIREARLPSIRELGTEETAYLLGVMDVVGELKRESVEALREGRGKDANMYYGFMKGIYDSTRGMRFASSLVPEFRRKQDTARIQVETTASELLNSSSKQAFK